MANTYTQLYFHIVFAVKGRSNHISTKWKTDLYKYITGIVYNQGQKMMFINGMPDHIHILLGTNPDCILSDLIRDIKANSSKWINEQRFIKGKFSWQTGFGAFTLNQSQLTKVTEYIKNQEAHHRKKSFREEYVDFLVANKIDYNEK